MKNLHAALLAALFGLSAVAGAFVHPQVAAADPGDRGQGRAHRNGNANGNSQGNRARNPNWQNGRWSNCNPAGHIRGRSNHVDNDNENDNDNDEDDQNRNATGQNGRNGRNNSCTFNGGGFGQQGNATIQGVITAVNGNQVTIATGIGQSVTVNDQPALDNQATGRVSVGRFVTVNGYWQNSVFYATQIS